MSAAERKRNSRGLKLETSPAPSPKKRKSPVACVFCRRSHMTCSDERPCTRCVRREIGHLCRDEPTQTTSKGKGSKAKAQAQPAVAPEDDAVPTPSTSRATLPAASTSSYNSLQALSSYPVSAFDDLQPSRNEFYGPNLTDFLRSFDDPTLFQNDESLLPFIQAFPAEASESSNVISPSQPPPANPDADPLDPPSALPKPSKDERYLMTAADQRDGPRNERLARVIHAKYEAGLLKPFDHVAGYRRLSRWMETHMSASSRQRTLQTISEFRPAFRKVAASLTDLDLVFIEESFERLLLDYDRMFANMPIPACLWRRTGEIFKANVAFAELVGVPIDQFKDGRLAIYELMAGESAGSYWAKYGKVCFDVNQKAVLTNCVLHNQATKQDVPCAFSFTIRRDSVQLPYCVVGNFLVSALSEIPDAPTGMSDGRQS